MVVLKGITFGFSLLMDRQGPCTSETTLYTLDDFFTFDAYKTHTPEHSYRFRYEINCQSLHKKFKNHVGTFLNPFFSPLSKRYRRFLPLIIPLLLVGSFHLERNIFKSDVEVAFGLSSHFLSSSSVNVQHICPAFNC